MQVRSHRSRLHEMRTRPSARDVFAGCFFRLPFISVSPHFSADSCSHSTILRSRSDSHFRLNSDPPIGEILIGEIQSEMIIGPLAHDVSAGCCFRLCFCDVFPNLSATFCPHSGMSLCRSRRHFGQTAFAFWFILVQS